jgi:hypothetical protein
MAHLRESSGNVLLVNPIIMDSVAGNSIVKGKSYAQKRIEEFLNEIESPTFREL